MKFKILEKEQKNIVVLDVEKVKKIKGDIFDINLEIIQKYFGELVSDAIKQLMFIFTGIGQQVL